MTHFFICNNHILYFQTSRYQNKVHSSCANRLPNKIRGIFNLVRGLSGLYLVFVDGDLDVVIRVLFLLLLFFVVFLLATSYSISLTIK
jgi:hypothetical protein